MQHGLQQFNKIDRHLAPTGCAVESGLKNFDLLLVAIEGYRLNRSTKMFCKTEGDIDQNYKST